MTRDGCNIASHLPAMAACQPDVPAVIVQRAGEYFEISFRELEDESNRVARGSVIHAR